MPILWQQRLSARLITQPTGQDPLYTYLIPVVGLQYCSPTTIQSLYILTECIEITGPCLGGGGLRIYIFMQISALHLAGTVRHLPTWTIQRAEGSGVNGMAGCAWL
jgi:hypothetical protein